MPFASEQFSPEAGLSLPSPAPPIQATSWPLRTWRSARAPGSLTLAAFPILKLAAHSARFPAARQSPLAFRTTDVIGPRSAAGKPHQTRFLDEPCRRGDKTTSRRARSDSPRSIFRLPSGRAERSETATAMSPSDRNKRKFNVKERTHFRAVLVRQSFRLEVRTPRGANK